jgi:hypothetical protein
MRPIVETVEDLRAGTEVLRRRRYGVICAADGRFGRVVLRPLPKLTSVPAMLLTRAVRRRSPGDRCRLYYNQPLRFPRFLAVTCLVSDRGTSLATVRRALEVLDLVARVKRSDALLCDVANWRITPEMLARYGWEPHCPGRWHRHYIKRFYGEYPPLPGWILKALTASKVESDWSCPV